MSDATDLRDEIAAWREQVLAELRAPEPEPPRRTWDDVLRDEPYVGRHTRQALAERGYGTPQAVAASGPRSIQIVPGVGQKRAGQLVRLAERFIRDNGPELVEDAAAQPASDDGAGARLDGPKLRRWRLDLGLTQQQVGDAVGVSRMAVSLWERGGTITDENRLRLAETLLSAADAAAETESAP